MIDRFTLSPAEFFVLRTRTRFPFRYGIASLTEVPHLFLRLRVTIGTQSSFGLASEGLPPKWFTKDPATSFEQDLEGMFDVIGHAAAQAETIGRQPVSFFGLWRELDAAQSSWAAAGGHAPLLAHLGVSLVERAVLDGMCRILGQPLHRAIAENRLGLQLGAVYPELGDLAPADLLPSSPLDACFVRHTIGLADALGPSDMAAADRVDDGLPQDLESSIRAYGLRYFKVKLSADLDRDVPRLSELGRLLERETGGDYVVTADGNENFADFTAFRRFWQTVLAQPALRDLWPHVIIVEQPVHRMHALGDDARASLQAWPDRPPLILDESDGAVGDVPRAIDDGYAGASHKNCKGITKGIANAALLAKRRRDGAATVLTGEDLCTLGPFAMVEDIAMMALLGIPHVERNGHHYYRGLSMFPDAWQDALLAAHPDLYRRHEQGFVCLRIEGGRLDLRSVNAAPFGVAPLMDFGQMTILDRSSLIPNR